LKFKIIPLILLIIIGIIARVYIEIKNISWVFGSSGPSLDELIPGYVVFIIASIVLSIVIVKKYSYRSVRIYLLITWMFIFTFALIDIGSDLYIKAYNYYGEHQVNNLKKFYLENEIEGYVFEDVLWYTQKQTVYIFSKEEKISENDFSNNKEFKSIENDGLLERMAIYYYDN